MLSIANLLEFEGQVGEYRWYGIEPSVLYPTVLSYLAGVNAITLDDLIVAQIPRDKVPDLAALQKRNYFLEFARKFFTLQLVAQLGDGSCLHIKNDPAWRLA
jgi:hypothetical protein